MKNQSKKVKTLPGKTIFVLFTSSTSLLTLSIQKEFEELADHVKVISITSKIKLSVRWFVVVCESLYNNKQVFDSVC